jgi:hypothetical protein
MKPSCLRSSVVLFLSSIAAACALGCSLSIDEGGTGTDASTDGDGFADTSSLADTGSPQDTGSLQDTGPLQDTGSPVDSGSVAETSVPEASPCLNGATSCSGVCEYLLGDPANCGACGNVCDSTHVCVGGACEPGVSSEDDPIHGFINWGSVELHLSASRSPPRRRSPTGSPDPLRREEGRRILVETERGRRRGEEPYSCTVTTPDDGIAKGSAERRRPSNWPRLPDSWRPRPRVRGRS